MTLDEVESKRQLRAALKKGDPELEAEIEREIDRKIDNAWQHATYEFEVGLEPEEIIWRAKATFGENLTGLLDYFHQADEVSEILEDVPDEQIAGALKGEIESAAERLSDWTKRGRVTKGSDLFTFASGQGPGPELGAVQMELRVRLDEEPLSWVPAKYVEEVLKNKGPYGAEWEEIDEGEYTTGWIDSGDYWRLEVDRNADPEWAQDVRQEYFSGLVDAEPAEAIKVLLSELQKRFPDLYQRVRKAKLPKEVLADYAVAYFQDPEEGVDLLSEAMGIFDYEGSAGEVILEIDRDTLRKIGVTRGRWWDAAPWKLIDLPVEELAYEGTLMRHCVGRRDMGYREAVARGYTSVWSLRSRANKPVFTFEIDQRAWEAADDAPHPHPRIQRGQAIVQLKGKLNRTVGKDAAETAVLDWIFSELDVDPTAVADFRPGRAANPRSFCGPWTPYHARPRARPNAGPRPPTQLKRRLLR